MSRLLGMGFRPQCGQRPSLSRFLFGLQTLPLVDLQAGPIHKSASDNPRFCLSPQFAFLKLLGYKPGREAFIDNPGGLSALAITETSQLTKRFHPKELCTVRRSAGA